MRLAGRNTDNPVCQDILKNNIVAPNEQKLIALSEIAEPEKLIAAEPVIAEPAKIMGEIKLYTIDSERVSVERLGFPTFTHLGSYVDAEKNNIIIRFGNSTLLYNNNASKQIEFPNVLQTSKAIANNCSKDESLAKMAKVVPTPKMYKVGDIIPKNKLIVFRRNQHSGGQGFQVTKFPTPHKVESGFYGTEFISTDKELRCWFINSRVITGRRVTQSAERLKQKYKCRSLWPYKMWHTTPKKLEKYVLAAAKELGLIFGAADIIFKNGKYYFLENNSCPTLDHPKIIKFFKQGLARLVKKNFSDFNKQSKTKIKKIAAKKIWAEI